MRVHDSQAHRKMDVTRERISRILELREILLSFLSMLLLSARPAWSSLMESIIMDSAYQEKVTLQPRSTPISVCHVIFASFKSAGGVTLSKLHFLLLLFLEKRSHFFMKKDTLLQNLLLPVPPLKQTNKTAKQQILAKVVCWLQ